MPANNTPLPSSFDGDNEFYEENRWQKLSRRIREEPLIPLGVAATCAALMGASRSIKAGDHNKTNRMFRLRIYGQAFTIIAMVAGAKYWEGDRAKRKEFEEALAERKAKERSEAWLKELEARDQEEKDIQALREKRKAAAVPAAQTQKAADSQDLDAEKKIKRSGVLDAVAALEKK